MYRRNNELISKLQEAQEENLQLNEALANVSSIYTHLIHHPPFLLLFEPFCLAWYVLYCYIIIAGCTKLYESRW